MLAVRVLRVAEDPYDDQADGVADKALRGPMVAVIRLARAIALSGLARLQAMEELAQKPAEKRTKEEQAEFDEEGADTWTLMLGEDVGRAFIDQCKHAASIFRGSFVIGRARSGAGGARVVAVPTWVKQLASRMSRALLTGLADDMIDLILRAHGKLYVGVAKPRAPRTQAEIERMKMFAGMITSKSQVGIMPRG